MGRISSIARKLATTTNIVSARSIEGLMVGYAPYLLPQDNRKTPIDQHNREYAPYKVGVGLPRGGLHRRGA